MHEYGSDPSFADEVALAGLVGFAERIDEHIEDISSVDDLESFVQELKQLMKRLNFDDARLTRRIDKKRDELCDFEDDNAGERYNTTPTSPTDREMSTDQIRSMFNAMHIA